MAKINYRTKDRLWTVQDERSLADAIYDCIYQGQLYFDTEELAGRILEADRADGWGTRVRQILRTHEQYESCLCDFRFHDPGLDGAVTEALSILQSATAAMLAGLGVETKPREEVSEAA